MKTHKNQWLLTLLSLPDIPCGAINQGTHYAQWAETSGSWIWRRSINQSEHLVSDVLRLLGGHVKK